MKKVFYVLIVFFIGFIFGKSSGIFRRIEYCKLSKEIQIEQSIPQVIEVMDMPSSITIIDTSVLFTYPGSTILFLPPVYLTFDNKFKLKQISDCDD
jgi:hypothetical protein